MKLESCNHAKTKKGEAFRAQVVKRVTGAQNLPAPVRAATAPKVPVQSL